MNTPIKTKIEIVLPTWAHRSGPGYWGDTDYSGHDLQCSSLWLSLRGVVPGDPSSDMHEGCRALSDIGLYVWLAGYAGDGQYRPASA